MYNSICMVFFLGFLHCPGFIELTITVCALQLNENQPRPNDGEKINPIGTNTLYAHAHTILSI